MIPFAVVGSERNVLIDGKQVRGRKNRWGVINIEDENHCEFVYLRNFLTRFVQFQKKFRFGPEVSFSFSLTIIAFSQTLF